MATGTTDAVDEFLGQWARECPDMDASPMGAIGRLFRASRVVEKGVKAYLSGEGMEFWEFDVLATLRRSGSPYTLSPRDLVATTMVGSAAMTNRVDRLVSRDLVTREVDQDNRRRLLISLTADGLALVERTVEGHVANERRILEGLEDSEQEDLNMLLRKLLLSLGDGR